MTNEREGFEKAIAADRYDKTNRLVYADWLEEHGLDDEAATQRYWAANTPKIQEAEDWMRNFAGQCGQTCENYGGYSKEYYEASEKWWNDLSVLNKKDPPDEEAVRSMFVNQPRPEDFPYEPEAYRDITYEDVLKAGTDYVESGGNDWFTQMGSEEARTLIWQGDNHEKYWDAWELLTGKKRLQDSDNSTNSPFSCSC